MRKYLLVFLFIISAITSFAQYPNNTGNGNDSTLQSLKDAVRSKFVNVTFGDTTAANLQRIKAYPGAQIFTTSDNSFWTRNRTATKWLRVNGYCGGLIGGIVSYSGTGLTLNVTAATQYCINNTSYSAPAISVTLATANPSNPRFDLIVADTFGVISAITGTAAASPVLPQANPLSQYPLAYISVPAGATTPGGITTTVIYDENTGGEWAHTTFGTITSNFNDVVNPFHLTKDIRTTNINASARVGIQFDNGAPIQAVNYNSLNIHIAPVTASATNIIVSLTKEDVVNTIPISIPVSASTAYQTLSIPLSSFSFTGAGDFFDGVQIQFTTTSTTGYYLDYITLQIGITPPPTGNYWTRNGNHLYPTAIGDSVGIKTNNPGYPLDVNGLAHVGSLYIQDGGDDAYIGTAGGGMGEYVDATQNFTYANNSFGANGNDFWVNHPPTAADADSIWGFTGDHLIKIPKPPAGGSGTVTNVTATYPIQITGTSTLTPNVKADTGRALTQLVTGFDLNKVRDSVQANLIDSLRRLSGSVNVQARKNGVWITQYQDSANGDFIPITGTTPGHNVTGDVISDREFYAEGFHSGQTVTAFGQITSGTNSHQGSFELFDGGAGNSATIRTDAQSGTAGILLIPDLNSTTITSTISVDGLFANAAGNVDLSGVYATQSALNDTAAAIRADFPSGGGGGIDSVRKMLGTDKILQYSSGSGSTAFLIPKVFYAKDNYGGFGGVKADGITNDRDALQAVFNAAYDSAYNSIVVLPEGKILAQGTLVNSGGTGIGSPNSLLYIKYEPVATGSGYSRSIKIIGGTPPTPNASVLGPYAINKSGTIIYSDITGSGTLPSILGSDGSASVNGFNIATVTLENINFRVKANALASGPTMSAVNFSKVAFVRVENIVCDIDTPSVYAAFPSAATYGIIMPGPDNGAYSAINNTLVTGYKYGYGFNEHSTGSNINAIGCAVAYQMGTGGGASHDMHFGRMGAQWCRYTIQGAGVSNVLIENLDIEHQESPTYSDWFNNTYTIYDSLNLITGYINYHMVQRGGALGNTQFLINGGTNLQYKFIDSNMATQTRALNLFSGNRPLPGGYTAYNGAFLGSTNKGSVLDFMHNNTEIAQGYTTATDFNFYGYSGKALNFYTNGNLSTPAIALATTQYVGIGNPTPSTILDILKSQNAGTYSQIVNATSGTGAYAANFVSTKTNLSDAVGTFAVSAAYTTSGILAANTGVHYSSMPSGFNIGTTTNSQTSFWSNNLERVSILGNGNVGFNNTAPAHKIDVIGNIRDSAGYIIQPPGYFTPTTGSTISTVTGTNIIEPAGALLALTINLPSSPSNGEVVHYTFTQAITTVTFANGTTVNPITTTAAGGVIGWQYYSGTASWYKY